MEQSLEEFSESQREILRRYVTNTSKNVFVLQNLPEVIKGAVFSRYSRSSLGLRTLLLKEFILNENTAFDSIVGKDGDKPKEESAVAIKKAQNFYDRILDGYGDDSIGELGGAHLAVEGISMLGAKVIEDARIGGSPLEKSTRYVYFDQKVGGEYLFYKEPILMTSAYRELYLNTCNHLFETYSKLIPLLTEKIEGNFPKEHDVSKAAYTAALRAKVLDCLRGLLPASSMTNLGVFGNGRFFETLVQRLNSHNLVEMQEVGKDAYQELSKVIPSFVRRSDLSHKYQKTYTQFVEQMDNDLKILAENYAPEIEESKQPGVKLLSFDQESPSRVAGALLFSHSTASLDDLQRFCKKLPEEEILRILDVAASNRENRRHKSPRALEHAEFTFEILSDFGVYRDLHRHRMLTQERQLLSCGYGYYIPQEIMGTEMEKDYIDAMEMAKKAYEAISEELPEEAQYVVPMAYNIRWYFHVNLRALQWLCELRSSPAGHPKYRHIAQEMARQVCDALPCFERFFKFVDYDGYDLGRMDQEEKKVKKLETLIQ